MRRKIYLYWKNEQCYEVVSDATVTEEFSETLDSASVVLPSLLATDGIVFGAKPYDEVYLSVMYDGVEEYGSRFLIDSIDSTQVSYTGEGRFDVTLQLMSETKQLEKIQLPNKAFTHSKIKGAKTLYEAADYLIDTYSPRYVGENEIMPLLEIDPNADWTRFKSTPCADVVMSKPTLRQALTTLFAQIGCIPVVKDRKITYLDLGQERTDFKFGGQGPELVASVRMGMSSDSWVNSLVSESSQSVDYDSSCIIEHMCFRDRENVLLKQTDNLKLEMRYPIYEVKKLVANAYVRLSGESPTFNRRIIWWYQGAVGYAGVLSGIGGFGSYFTPPYTEKKQPNGGLKVSFTTSYSYSALRVAPWGLLKDTTITASGTMHFSVTLAKVDATTGRLTAIKKLVKSVEVSYSSVKPSGTWTAKIVQLFPSSDYTGNEVTMATFSFDGELYIDGELWTPGVFNPNFGFATDSFSKTQVTYNVYPSRFDFGEVSSSTHIGPDALNPGWFNALPFDYNSSKEYAWRSSADITPLCVESSKRAQLEVDFLKMPAWSSIEEMSKYLYATVGYSIGGTSIEGFSATYTQSHGFWDTTKTYIENIIDAVDIKMEGLNHFFGDIIPQEMWGTFYSTAGLKASLYNPFFDSNANNFSLLSFDVEYIPLIQSKTSYEKADVPLLIEQLDSAESGVSSVDAVSASETEKVERLGNPAWTVHARKETFDSLPALNSSWNGRVAFKRVLKFGANAIDAEYALAESYVLKNYFTSIVTKYRAFEYVDYTQSVERRELMRGYIRISKTLSNENNVWGGSSNGNITDSDDMARMLMGALEGYCDSSRRLIGAGYWDKFVTECELSAICAGPSVVFTMKEYDNASDGPFVDGTYLTIDGDYSSNPIGGIPQQWYESRGDEVPKIELHSQNLTIKGMEWSEDPSAFLSEAVGLVQKYPRFPADEYGHDWLSSYFLQFPFERKDIAELMSYSLQVTACWATSDAFEDKSKARFSKWLFHFSPLLGGYPSETAVLVAKASSDTSMTWTGAKRAWDAQTDKFTSLEYFWKHSTATKYAEVNALVQGLDRLSAVEVCILDADAGEVYPLAWFAKNVFSMVKGQDGSEAEARRVYLSLVPSKTDKTLKISDEHSLLYEE